MFTNTNKKINYTLNIPYHFELFCFHCKHWQSPTCTDNCRVEPTGFEKEEERSP